MTLPEVIAPAAVTKDVGLSAKGRMSSICSPSIYPKGMLSLADRATSLVAAVGAMTSNEHMLSMCRYVLRCAGG